MNGSIIRIGSRESVLAVIQSELVMGWIRERYPQLELKLVTMKTTGDKIQNRPLNQVGGKGLFVKELDQALLQGRIDLSVHSLKDMPMEQPEGLPILAFSRREDPRDALVLPVGAGGLDPAKPLGCSSARRAVQLQRLFPGMRVESVRGNVLTRLKKLDEGQYAGLVLACAGLRRLGLEERINRIFSPEELLPAAGQGILAVQGRAGEPHSYLEAVDDPTARAEALAERAFVRRLGGGCFAPVAAYARRAGEQLVLTGLWSPREGVLLQETQQAPLCEAERLGRQLAESLRQKR
ncbi:MAG TPA: hydroxymethylbilane synthase [Candidatus Anaerotruncus excrementipullorum]|uniref:Porphobilinogen deaminase n=1 Tax=Candidatus Anaerotruncus excrementipullorum TaxID=2838465 RepID=A0A9D1WSE8_9FIRM|nr:hydroxymethylbilane synthase [Candidatus Anaerotruncus excrementipullorum]